MLIDDVSLETPIDYLAVTFIVSLVGLPGAHLADTETAGSEAVRRPDHRRAGEESKLFALGRRIEEQPGFCHRPPPI